jgi:hypothetical protein
MIRVKQKDSYWHSAPRPSQEKHLDASCTPLQWCNAQEGNGKFFLDTFGYGLFYFEDSQDAVAFRLRWGV